MILMTINNIMTENTRENERDPKYICEQCDEDTYEDDLCHHDHHVFCRYCCEDREPMDWNDLD